MSEADEDFTDGDDLHTRMERLRRPVQQAASRDPLGGTEFFDRRTGPARTPNTVPRHVSKYMGRGPRGAATVLDEYGAMFYIVQGADGKWVEL